MKYATFEKWKFVWLIPLFLCDSRFHNFDILATLDVNSEYSTLCIQRPVRSFVMYK